jgi:anti-sigma factor RsiW
VAKLTDDMLMAYADGQLSALARAKVEAMLPSDPDARRRLAIFRATGAPLAKLYGQPMAEPAPQHLRDFVLNYPPPEAKAAAKAGALKTLAGGAGHALKGFAGWLLAPAAVPGRWQLAAASAALVALGASAGFFAHGAGEPLSGLVAFQDGRIFASGPFQHVLETAASNEAARISGRAGEAVTMRATLTFKAKDKGYCREYEIAAPGGGFRGLGCRERNGAWALEVHVPARGSAAQAWQPAGSRAESLALDGIVDRLIDGDALDRGDEAKAIAGGWR